MSELETSDLALALCEKFHKLLAMKNQAQRGFYKALGARIRELRGSTRSQEQLAKAVGLSRTSLVNIEAGERKVLVHVLFRIAEALGVSPSEIINPLEPAKNPNAAVKLPHGVSEPVSEWVQRSVSKAITSQSSS